MAKRKTAMLGLLCGAICALCLFGYGNEVKAQADAERDEILSRFGSEQVDVLVATRDILPGEVLGPINAEKRTWPSELLPDGAVMGFDQVALPASSLILSGEVVTQGRFIQGGTTTVTVPEGLCALSVSAKAVSAVGGSVAKGSRVDVYSTSDLGTDLLVSDALVLATSADEESVEITWITLALDPSRVSEVIEASQRSNLYFALPSEDARGAAERIEQMRQWEREEEDELAPEVELGVEPVEASEPKAALLKDDDLGIESIEADSKVDVKATI